MSLTLSPEHRAQLDALRQLVDEGHYDEAREQAEGLLAQAQDTALKVALCRLLAEVETDRGKLREALGHLTKALGALDDEDDPAARAEVYIALGLTYVALHLPPMAGWHFEEALRLYRALQDRRGMAIALNRLGVVALMEKKFAAARQHFSESLRLSEALGDAHLMAGAYVNLGEVARLQGDLDEARACYQQAGELFAGLRLRRGVLIVENNLGHVAAAAGDLETARRHYRRAADLALAMNAVPHMLDTLAGLALTLIQQNRHREAAPLLAYVFHHPLLLDETRDLLEARLEALGGIRAAPAYAPSHAEGVADLLQRTCGLVFGPAQEEA